MIDLTYTPAIHSSFFIKIDSPSNTLLFSDHFVSQVINGETYTPLGKLMNVGNSSSELRPSFQSVSVSISGVLDSDKQKVLSIKYKGAPVTIYRGLFDVASGELLTGGTNPVVKFKGFVNNWTLDENYDVVNRTSTNVIQFECTSLIDLLSKKRAGRKTNSASMKRFFSTDTSFDRVSKLVNTEFNFGGKDQ